MTEMFKQLDEVKEFYIDQLQAKIAFVEESEPNSPGSKFS